MIDFLCLPQKPFSSEGEKARFKRSLSLINTCYFEKNAANVTKTVGCLLDFAKYKGATKFCHRDGCTDQMGRGVQAPVSPEVFGQTMRTRVQSGELQFTAKADLELVIEQYETGFIETINVVAAQANPQFRVLAWMFMKWGDTEGA